MRLPVGAPSRPPLCAPSRRYDHDDGLEQYVRFALDERVPSPSLPDGGEVADATAVVHAAYGTGSGPDGGMTAVTVAADAMGARRIVAFSSIAYYGACTGTVSEARTLERKNAQ